MAPWIHNAVNILSLKPLNCIADSSYDRKFDNVFEFLIMVSKTSDTKEVKMQVNNSYQFQVI